MLKILQHQSEYLTAQAELAALMRSSPPPDSNEHTRLELLALLISDYEKRKVTILPPDPVDALLFRMEQQKLVPRDLIPFVGSRSKVSEILSRTRPLTLSMIRALHEGLGIPASILIQESSEESTSTCDPDWSQFPVREMVARGWLTDSGDALRELFASFSLEVQTALHLKRTKHIRSARKMDLYALTAWVARVYSRGQEVPSLGIYRPDTITTDVLKSLARLSTSSDGPVLAQKFLAELGIPLVVEPHLPHTYLDGAAITLSPSRPIIGLTLRHDRLDSFWFTLMHELAHILLHAGKDSSEFIDDLDLEAKDDPIEREADEFAGEALIPELEWKKSPASRLRSPEAVTHLAKVLAIHPAIVAGRVRHQWKAYRLFSNLVGLRMVRKHFPNLNWND